MLVRSTALGSALFQAALAIPESRRAATIANQIVWRGENTKAGVVQEREVTLPGAFRIRGLLFKYEHAIKMRDAEATEYLGSVVAMLAKKYNVAGDERVVALQRLAISTFTN